MSNIFSKTLAAALKNIEQRSGNLTVANVEAEVINRSCLEILKCRRNGIPVDELRLVTSFTTAAKELIPEYDDARAAYAPMGVMANLSWEGMWDHLRNYYLKTHGENIDGVEVDMLTYFSGRHKRYENNVFVSESEVQRIVNLAFTNERKEIMVTIEPSLSSKPGTLARKNGNTCIYVGKDPDYLFTITFDEFDEVEGFSMELVNRKVKVEYFE